MCSVVGHLLAFPCLTLVPSLCLDRTVSSAKEVSALYPGRHPVAPVAADPPLHITPNVRKPPCLAEACLRPRVAYLLPCKPVDSKRRGDDEPAFWEAAKAPRIHKRLALQPRVFHSVTLSSSVARASCHVAGRPIRKEAVCHSPAPSSVEAGSLQQHLKQRAFLRWLWRMVHRKEKGTRPAMAMEHTFTIWHSYHNNYMGVFVPQKNFWIGHDNVINGKLPQSSKT
jgi:hypothetical protein